MSNCIYVPSSQITNKRRRRPLASSQILFRSFSDGRWKESSALYLPVIVTLFLFVALAHVALPLAAIENAGSLAAIGIVGAGVAGAATSTASAAAATEEPSSTYQSSSLSSSSSLSPMLPFLWLSAAASALAKSPPPPPR
jgi:hypothetical protein